MAKSDGLTELAILLKERENDIPKSITTGTVITPPPEVTIRLNDVVILNKENLIFSAHMLAGYKRDLHPIFNDENCGQTNVVSMHSHIVQTLNVDTEDAHTTTLDTIVEGDEVILMPTTDDQLYFVLDKAVRFE
ncbi:DUF2577 family protein [Rummeliibacillus sp. NPDC094406]|uniref:DUF2577 family protein n=1 Tax=Rummeliibacillus sp. NPDC094406 TaxID=3364511 RepID=UPI0038156EF8